MSYIYFKENNTLQRFSVLQDNDPENPREFEGNVCSMMCWHDRYNLGDKNPFDNPDEFLNEMIEQEYTTSQIFRYIKYNTTDNKLRCVYDMVTKQWLLYGNVSIPSSNGYKKEELMIDDCLNKDWLVDSVLDYMTINDKIRMLEKKKYVFFPLAIYDHSGITMYMGSRFDHFDGRWDCSDVGWIYTDRKRLIQSGCANAKNWKKKAEELCRAEVFEFDAYLQGECYGIRVEEFNSNKYNPAEYEKDENWDVMDECYGFIVPDLYGERLINHLFKETINAPIFALPIAHAA